MLVNTSVINQITEYFSDQSRLLIMPGFMGLKTLKLFFLGGYFKCLSHLSKERTRYKYKAFILGTYWHFTHFTQVSLLTQLVFKFSCFVCILIVYGGIGVYVYFVCVLVWQVEDSMCPALSLSTIFFWGSLSLTWS